MKTLCLSEVAVFLYISKSKDEHRLDLYVYLPRATETSECSSVNAGMIVAGKNHAMVCNVS